MNPFASNYNVVLIGIWKGWLDVPNINSVWYSACLAHESRSDVWLFGFLACSARKTAERAQAFEESHKVGVVGPRPRSGRGLRWRDCATVPKLLSSMQVLPLPYLPLIFAGRSCLHL